MSTSSPISPRLVKGGLVTMDPTTSTVRTVIALQYNPDSLARTLQIQSLPGGADGVHIDALRLRGPAIETIKLEAELDATDQLALPTKPENKTFVQFGLQPQLAQLEMLINPTVETLIADDNMANAGTLEIIPLEQPLTLLEACHEQPAADTHTTRSSPVGQLFGMIAPLASQSSQKMSGSPRYLAAIRSRRSF